MPVRIDWSVLASVALLGACAQVPIADQRSARQTPQDAQAQAWNGSRLYARDGSVISQAPLASQDARTAAPRELESSDGGRMYILELYQKAIDERDALHGELESLRTQMRSVQEALIASESDLDAADVQLEQARAENKRLLAENVELAARLTTAQIRRLQVEKILLETRIEELGALQAAAAAGASTPAPAQARPDERKP